MSSGVEIVVLTPLILSALSQLGIGLACSAAAGVAGQQLYAAGKAAAEVLEAMRGEQAAALAELAYLEKRELQAAHVRASEEAAASSHARSLAALTMRRAAGGARQMLVAGLERLGERVAGLDPVPPDVLEATAALRQMLAQPEYDLDAALENYRDLSAKVGELLLAQALASLPPATDTHAKALAELVAEMRILLDDPWFASATGQVKRAELAQRMQELEQLAQQQPRFAESLAQQLRIRIKTALDDIAAQAQAQSAQAKRLRGVTSQFLAVLAALEVQGVPSAQREQAGQLRTRYAAVLADCADEQLEAELTQLLTAAQALLNALQHELTAVAAQSIVGGQIVDVLSGLGYAVELMEAPAGQGQGQHMHVPISPVAGIDISLGADGLVKTELAAYEQLDDTAVKFSEKQACGVMDELLKQLAERKLEVRERFRTHYASGEHPPVVKRRERKIRQQQPGTAERYLDAPDGGARKG